MPKDPFKLPPLPEPADLKASDFTPQERRLLQELLWLRRHVIAMDAAVNRLAAAYKELPESLRKRKNPQAKQCVECRKWFKPLPKPGPVPKYCSKRCKNARAARLMAERRAVEAPESPAGAFTPSAAPTPPATPNVPSEPPVSPVDVPDPLLEDDQFDWMGDDHD